MPILYLFLKSIGVGFAVAAPVGPIGLLCMRLTLEKGRLAGIAGGLGAALADAIFAAVALLGVSALKSLIEAQRFWLEAGGGVFLLAFGLYLMRKRTTIAAGGHGEIPDTLLAEFLKTLLLTLINPSTILSFMAIFLALPWTAEIEIRAMPWLILGIFLGASLWWLSLALGIGLVRHRVSPALFSSLNRLAGAFLLGFGLYTLWHLAMLRW